MAAHVFSHLGEAPYRLVGRKDMLFAVADLKLSP